MIIGNSGKPEIRVGSLGKIRFDKSWYAYVGSGLNNLEKRIERHLQNDKKTHWHIDYLLKKATVKDVFYGKCGKRKECEIASNLSEKFSHVDSFGSTDCNCESHLFYCEDINELKKETVSSFEKAKLEPKKW